MKFGIILPTCRPELLRVMASTLVWLRPFEATFLINFNGPQWTREKIDRALVDFCGWDVRYDWTQHEQVEGKDPMMVMLRHQCAELGPDCDWYILMDDDFRFSPGTPTGKYTSGERYCDIMDHIRTHPNTGIVQTRGFLGGQKYGRRLVKVERGKFSTGRGLFLKRLGNRQEDTTGFAPPASHYVRGALEETILAYYRLEQRFDAYRAWNTPTIHRHHHKWTWAESELYIRQRYHDPEWDFLKDNFPRGIHAV